MIFIPKSILNLNFAPRKDEENCIFFFEFFFKELVLVRGKENEIKFGR